MNNDNDLDIQIDNYGSPLAPPVEYLPQIMYINNKPTIIDTDQAINLISDVIAPNDNSAITTSVPKDQNISQKPSSDIPDQNNPDKYINNDQQTLNKVINTPVFYKDTQQSKEFVFLKFH